ncbi:MULTISPECIES: hypothetical protein [unclassified Paraburkholderia]|uniref:hypothetical protein n=1 Tax=unclassified Paraburkholderia TaxID=2615204 RepID=UPI002AB1DF26|nr:MULTISPECIES: hypothetical protein [unclassified Paraburkholderia]
MEQLQSAVNAAFSNVVASGVIEKAIEEQLTKCVTSIINDHLRSYSDFGKQLEKAVESALKVDFDNLGLPGYNDLILKIIRAQVAQHTSGSIAGQIEEQMKELLAPAPAEIKLSTLVEEFIKDAHDEIGCSCDSPDRITLVVRDGTDGGRYSTLKDFYHIYLDAQPDKEHYRCAYRIAVHDGHVYSVTIDEKDPSKTFFVGPVRGFDKRVFQLYAAKSKLIVDGNEDDINTYYPGHDD